MNAEYIHGQAKRFLPLLRVARSHYTTHADLIDRQLSEQGHPKHYDQWEKIIAAADHINSAIELLEETK